MMSQLLTNTEKTKNMRLTVQTTLIRPRYAILIVIVIVVFPTINQDSYESHDQHCIDHMSYTFLAFYHDTPCQTSTSSSHQSCGGGSRGGGFPWNQSLAASACSIEEKTERPARCSRDLRSGSRLTIATAKPKRSASRRIRSPSRWVAGNRASHGRSNTTRSACARRR